MYAQVIVDIAHENVDRVYTYRIPSGMDVERGMRVKVPFGRQVKEGYVLNLTDSCDYDADKIREVMETLEDYPALLPQIIPCPSLTFCFLTWRNFLSTAASFSPLRS